MGFNVSVSIHGVFVVMAIINLVFVFDSYTSFRRDYYKEWIYFVIWGIACLIPIVNEYLELFNKLNLLKLVGTVLLGMWIWGWVIMCGDNWTGIREDYRPLSSLLISFQIISIFLGYGSYKATNENGTTTEHEVNVV